MALERKFIAAFLQIGPSRFQSAIWAYPVRALELDAEAEVYVLLVTGVSVEIVRGTAVELVALAEFPPDEEAESYGAEAGRDPAYGFNQCGLFFRVILLAVGEGQDAGGRHFLGWGVAVAGCGAEPHIVDDSSGGLKFDETVVLIRCCFCVIASLTPNDSKGCNFK
jgi:hypothetical protein